MTHHTRRDFVRLACCSAATASLVAGLSKFGLVSALAQGTTDYKRWSASFCSVEMMQNNTIVPIDSNYTNYQTIRANLALPQASLLSLQIGGQSNFGLHPNLPDLQGLFQQSKVSGDPSQRLNTGATHDAAKLPEPYESAAESVFALRSAESVADNPA